MLTRDPAVTHSIPHHYASFPLHAPARHRPHLRPLDLASSPSTSPTKRLPSDYSRRPPPLITPPLTPSSFRSTTLNDTPSTPPEPRSPLRWVTNSGEAGRALASAHSLYTARIMGASNGNPNGGYLTPASARSQSMSSDDGSAIPPTTVVDVLALASGLASADATPRDERTLPFNDQDLSDLRETSSDPTRLVLVSICAT